MTGNLIDFLLSRIAEDEQVAFHQDGGLMVNAHFSAARVLAECEAKRRIVEAASAYWVEGASLGGHVAEVGLTSLALPYADHPDYREEWRP